MKCKSICKISHKTQFPETEVLTYTIVIEVRNANVEPYFPRTISRNNLVHKYMVYYYLHIVSDLLTLKLSHTKYTILDKKTLEACH